MKPPHSALPLLALGLGLGRVSAMTIPEKIAAANGAPSQAERMKVLEDTDFVFDFLNPPSAPVTGAGGALVSANVGNFPGLVKSGMAMTIGFIGPCGYNTPHTHPRATELNFAVNGTMKAGMLAENGVRYVFNDITPGSVVVFPRGSIHFTMNDGCDPMMFVAAFNNEDPGVLQVAQRFFGLAPSFVAASLGDLGIVEVAEIEANIPNNVALGIDECLQRCNIDRGEQPKSQRQPRLASNELPDGFQGPPPPSSSAAPAAPTARSVGSRAESRASISGNRRVMRLAARSQSNSTPSKSPRSSLLSANTFNVEGKAAHAVWLFLATGSAICVMIGIWALWKFISRKRGDGFERIQLKSPTPSISRSQWNERGEFIYDADSAHDVLFPPQYSRT